MFTLEDMRNLLHARPFVPFRLHLKEGPAVDVWSCEVVLLCRHHAVIGLLDSDATDTAFDRWAVAWYAYVTRVEILSAGSPTGPTESPVPAPA